MAGQKTSFKSLMREAAQQPPAEVEDAAIARNPQRVEAEGLRAAFEKSLGVEAVMQGLRLVEDALVNIMRGRAFFRDRDLIKNALNLAQKEVDPAILENPDFVDMIHWAVSRRPLLSVGTTGTLTTHEMWGMEEKVLELSGAESPAFVQPEAVVAAAIKRKEKISEEQIDAVNAACLSPKRVTVIEGTAGAGKSFTMEAVKEVYSEMGFDVIGTSLSWNAAKVLGASAQLDDDKCVAIEGLTRSWLNARATGTEPFQRDTLIIVDEAGMVGTRHMSIILETTALSRYNVKVVLTGDSLQVVPVDAGNPTEDIIARHGTTRIDTIRRQHQMSHRRAVKRLSMKHAGHAIHTFFQQERFRWCRNKDDLLNMVVRDYVSYRLANPSSKALVLAMSNKEVLELNYRIRSVYRKLGLIGSQDVRLRATDGREVFECGFSVGDEVVLRANDKNMMIYAVDPNTSPLDEKSWKPIRLGVFNRNAGRIVAIRRAASPIGSFDFVIDIAGDNPGRVLVNTATFKHSDKPGVPIVHNYANTIYGSQGMTVSHVMMLDTPRMDFRLAYVGMSRHKESVDVYLDETELHRRLDQSMGKRQSMESRLKMQQAGKDQDDASVELGRYNRMEMLRAVALAWSKHSENLSAGTYERLRRLGRKNASTSAGQTDIEAANPEDEHPDFIPEFNRPYPLVDVESILGLPDPIDDSELIRPSDVEQNKKRYATLEMPVDADRTPMPMPARSAPHRRVHDGRLPTAPDQEQDTVFGRMFARLLAGPRQEPLPPSPAPSPSRLSDPISPFEDLEGLQPAPPPPSQSLLEKLNAWMAPKPKVQVPFHPGHDRLCGRVIRPENLDDPEGVWQLDFAGTPQVLNVEGGPDQKWLSDNRKKLWDEGRFGEPRILAKDQYGRIQARYRFDGTCVVGQGLPPIIVNPHAGATGPIYIVAGPKEWLWLRQSMEQRYADTPQNIPHILWAAKDADLAMLAKGLAKASKVVVVRSKSDDRQLPWALDMQRILGERFRVQAEVSPPAPTPARPRP